MPDKQVNVKGTSARLLRNQRTDAELLALMLAYRKTGHSSDKPSQSQQDLTIALFSLVDKYCGIDRYTINPDERIRNGRLATTKGMANKALELADKIQGRMLDDAEKNGSLLSGWDENSRRSIASFVWNLGTFIAADMGRETVLEWVRTTRKLKPKKSEDTSEATASKAVDDDIKEENEIRDVADRLIADHIKRRKSGAVSALPKIEVVSTSDYEWSTGAVDDGSVPTGLPSQLQVSPNTPLASALRVHALVERLKVIGNEMPGEKIISKGKKKSLTADHKTIWYEFLALTPDQHEYLDDSLETLAHTRGWSHSKAKRLLADNFIFLQNHAMFDECCKLLVSRRESRNMDSKQLANAQSRAKEILEGKVPKKEENQTKRENAHDLFRKALQRWIIKYSQ